MLQHTEVNGTRRGIAVNLEPWVDGLVTRWQKVTARLAFWHRLPRLWHYIIFFLLLGLSVGLALYRKEIKEVASAGFWSLYLLLQVLVLTRTRTLSWQTITRLFMVGVWVISPLTILSQQVFLVFSPDASNLWNAAILGPILEETWKVVPVLLLLALPRRQRMLSVSDYALIGAAGGLGFQMVEEAFRLVRPVFSLFSMLDSLFGEGPQGYRLNEWFSGSWVGEVVFPGHGILAVGIAVGIGLAVRLRNRWRLVWILPSVMWLWAVLIHGVYNADTKSPVWLTKALEAVNDGRGYVHITVLLILLGVAIDYWHMSRVTEGIPLLPGERFINPLVEHWWPISLALNRQWSAAYLAPRWLRERRRLAHLTLLASETNDQPPELAPVRNRIGQWSPLVGLASLLLLWLGNAKADTNHAHIIQWFQRLWRWWKDLPLETQVAIIVGIVALTLLTIYVMPLIIDGIAGMATGGIELLGSRALAARLTQAGLSNVSVVRAAPSLRLWSLGISPRGKIIEGLLIRQGRLLTRNFPVIDAYITRLRLATSVKSINLLDKTYQTASGIRSVLNRYIGRLARFNGQLEWGADSVGKIGSRVLHVAIPEVITPAQVEALREMQQYALTQGVKLLITIVR